MKPLQDFMLLFSIPPGNQQPNAEEMTTMQQQWRAYIGGIAAQAKLVTTSQLGFESHLIAPDLSITAGPSISNNQTLSGNMIVKAASLEEAAEIAKGSPVLQMGGSVEVRNIIPMKF